MSKQQRRRDGKARWRTPHVEAYLDLGEFDRHRRNRSLERFKAKRLRDRRWMALREIVLYCVRCGSKTMSALYREVAEMVRSGELCDAHGRSLVLYLDPEPWALWSFPGRHRLSAEMIEGTVGHDRVYSDRDFAPGAPATEYLDQCWLGVIDAHWLLERSGYPWPAHFEPKPLLPIVSSQKPAAEPMASGAQRKVDNTRRRDRGRPAKKQPVAADAMRRALDEGRITLAALDTMTGKELVHEFGNGASPYPCRKAQKKVIEERMRSRE